MSESVTVRVAQGVLKGRKATAKSGSSYFSFQGVPYAKPPLGPLRFKAPQPPEPWEGELDAQKPGQVCRQLNILTKEYAGSEDCLYLNVYTPELPSDATASRPVMVSIHGGGFVMGSGNPDVYGPDFLLDTGVVVVTMNYRLNVLGFLCLEDAVAPGNYGLKDQVAALRWIQKNIANFGGDPNNVTIFGESAGGASVHYQMLSPMSKGLFHRAIAQSGSVFNPWASEKNPRKLAFRLGELLGYTGNDSQELVDFLRTIDLDTLVKSVQGALSERDKHRVLVFAFVPTLEVAVDGEEQFLPDDPMKLLQEGRYHSVPFMTGFTSVEAIIFFKICDMSNPEKIEKFNNNFEKTVLPDLRLPEDYPKTGDIATKIKKYYFNDQPLGEDKKGFMDLYSDILFNEGIIHSMKLMAQHPQAPLYLYQFSVDTKLAGFKYGILGTDYPGVSHGDDIGYLFNMGMREIDVIPDSPEEHAQKKVLEIWVNFAKTGNPTPKTSSLLPVIWPTYSVDNPCYMDIGNQLVVCQDLKKERIDFLEDLYSSA